MDRTTRRSALGRLLSRSRHVESKIQNLKSKINWARLRVDLRHTERLATVASFRTWRGSRASVAQSPKSDMFADHPSILAMSNRQNGSTRTHASSTSFRSTPIRLLDLRVPIVYCQPVANIVERLQQVIRGKGESKRCLRRIWKQRQGETLGPRRPK